MPFYQKSVLLLISFGMFLFAQDAICYPGFIGYGYKSCNTCHYNPLGNGPLTDYGRAVSATVISARPFYIDRLTTDDTLGERSGFFGTTINLPDWIRPAVGYRGMLLTQNLQSNPQFRLIQMQLDGNLTFKTSNDRLFAVMTFGYVPPPSNTPTGQSSDTSNLISRELYLAYRFSKEWGIYAGLMDIAYGIRISEHTAYSRTKTFLAQNDQTHGILIHTVQKNWEAAIHGILGNQNLDPSLQLRGFSTLFEVDTGNDSRLGLSFMAVNSGYRERRLGAIHTRVGYGEGASLLAETGVISNVELLGTSNLNHYLFLQTMIKLTRGFHFLMTAEYYAYPMFGSSIRYFRFGPSFQYFPMQRVEFRVDLQGTRTTGQSSVNSDIFNLLSQLHIWL